MEIQNTYVSFNLDDIIDKSNKPIKQDDQRDKRILVNEYTELEYSSIEILFNKFKLEAKEVSVEMLLLILNQNYRHFNCEILDYIPQELTTLKTLVEATQYKCWIDNFELHQKDTLQKLREIIKNDGTDTLIKNALTTAIFLGKIQ